MDVRLRKTYWASTLAALSLVTTACGSYECGRGGESGVNVDKATMGAMQMAEVTPMSADEAEAMALIKPVKVVWWHSMDGEPGRAAKQLVANFNAWHPEIRVKAVYQGTCDESLSTLKAATKAQADSESGPSLIQACDSGSRFMIDSGIVTPMQQFMDAEAYDVSALEPSIRHLYTFDGTKYAMPFYTSPPILYYNKARFMEAGLNPDSPPATLGGVAETADKLTKSGAAGATLAYSIADAHMLAWQELSMDGKPVRGLGGKIEDGRSAFINGQAAMILDSSASLRSIVDGVGGKFEVGTAFLPIPADAKEGGVVTGGASLWVLNNKPEAEQKAAWTFIKYLAEPKTQAEWSTHTGYFPITTKAYDKPILKDLMAKYPQFQTVVDLMHRTKSNAATKGAVMGVFPEARQQVETAIEEAFSGQKEPQAALDDAAKAITDKIANYNKTVAK